MKRSPHTGRARLVEPARDPIAVRPIATLEEAGRALETPGDWWGYLARPDTIRFLRQPGEAWRQDLADPALVEARIFRPEADLHWLEDRGVLLEAVFQDGTEAADPAGTTRIGGPGWAARDRRSRLWGEHLEGTETWYEEAIPDPLCYPGISPGLETRYVFLRYREYVRAGTVRFVRFLSLEGGAR